MGPRDPEELQRRLRVRFRDPALLRRALVHTSYANEHPEEPGPNERLEFLGDALLDFLVAEALFQRHPEADEGVLTAMRSALVSDEALARLAHQVGLGEFLLLGQGEEASGGRDRPSNLAAALEALVGAVYLDRGFGTARRMVLRLMKGAIAAVESSGVPKDAKSRLQEKVQGMGLPPPRYRLVRAVGSDHARRFTVEVVVGDRPLGRGRGRRKAEAEQEAARQALKALQRGVTQSN